MKRRGFDRLALLTTLICLAPMALGAYLYPGLPDRVAIHFSAAGAPNNFAPKAVAAFGLPLFLAVINAIVHMALNSDPKREGASGVVSAVGKWTAPAVSVIINPLILMIALRGDYGIMANIGPVLMAVMGILFAVLGNYLPKCRQNYTVGIKLPWTLSDEDNWNRTHRFAGYVWMLCGVIVAGGSFLLGDRVAWFIAIVAVMALSPVLYSFLLHRRAQ